MSNACEKRRLKQEKSRIKLLTLLKFLRSLGDVFFKWKHLLLAHNKLLLAVSVRFIGTNSEGLNRKFPGVVIEGVNLGFQ